MKLLFTCTLLLFTFYVYLFIEFNDLLLTILVICIDDIMVNGNQSTLQRLILFHRSSNAKAQSKEDQCSKVNCLVLLHLQLNSNCGLHPKLLEQFFITIGNKPSPPSEKL